MGNKTKKKIYYSALLEILLFLLIFLMIISLFYYFEAKEIEVLTKISKEINENLQISKLIKNEINEVENVISNTILFFTLIFFGVVTIKITALIYRKKKLAKFVEEETKVDDLTKAYTRKYLKTLLDEKNINKFSEYYLILIDIDNFKRINDTLGHLQGDKILIDLSRKSFEILKKDEYIFRIGGDEFIYLIKEENLSDFQYNMEVIKKEIGIEFSAGYTKILKDVQLKKLIKIADEEMYNSKKSRR